MNEDEDEDDDDGNGDVDENEDDAAAADDDDADGRDDGGKCQTLELQNRFGINNATPALHLFSSSTSLWVIHVGLGLGQTIILGLRLLSSTTSLWVIHDGGEADDKKKNASWLRWTTKIEGAGQCYQDLLIADLDDLLI